MTLTATIKSQKSSLTATLDPAIITRGKLDLYELAKTQGFDGSFDEFLASFRLDLSSLSTLISTDENNGLTLGSDNKLHINPLTKQDW